MCLGSRHSPDILSGQLVARLSQCFVLSLSTAHIPFFWIWTKNVQQIMKRKWSMEERRRKHGAKEQTYQTTWDKRKVKTFYGNVVQNPQQPERCSGPNPLVALKPPQALGLDHPVRTPPCVGVTPVGGVIAWLPDRRAKEEGASTARLRAAAEACEVLLAMPEEKLFHRAGFQDSSSAVQRLY